jgi:hypothetical protein
LSSARSNFALALICLGAYGQTSQPGSVVKVPNGLRIPAILSSQLSSKKSKLGDSLQLETVSDVHDGNGVVILPRHSKLYGRITYVASHQGKGHPAMLSFAVDRAEFHGRSVSLDAAVFGTYAGMTDSKIGEVVEGIGVATLRHTDSLNLVETTLMYDFRLPGNVPQAVHDARLKTVVMQLKIMPNPATRTAFVKDDGEIELNKEFLVVLLNGMRVVE